MDDDILLRSEGHSEVLLSVLRQLYRRHLLTDVTLVAEGREFQVHMIVLAAYSTYFKNLFDTGPSHCQSGYDPQYLNNIPASCLEILLEFLYTGAIRLNTSNVWLVLASAMELQIKTATDLCHKYDSAGFKHELVNNDLGKKTLSDDMVDSFTSLVPPIKSELLETGQSDFDLELDLFGPEPVNSKPSKPKRRKSSKQKKAAKKTRKKNQRLLVYSSESDLNDPDYDLESDLEDSNWMPVVKVTSTPSKVRRSPRKVKETASTLPQKKSKKTPIEASKSKGHHQCSVCSKTFLHFSTLKLHRKLHGIHSFPVNRYLNRHTDKTPDGQYPCAICEQRFSLHSLCARHRQLRHCTSNFRCRKCHTSFPTRRRLCMHRQKFHRVKFSLRTSKLKPCKHCCQVFLHHANLAKHMSEAHKEARVPRRKASRGRRMKKIKHLGSHKAASFWYTCHVCEARFHCKNVNSFCNHLKEAHSLTMEEIKEACDSSRHHKKNNPERNKCGECSANCKSRRDLLDHMKNTHPNVSFPCRICSYNTCLRTVLEKHMIQRHGKDSWTRSCEMCDRTFNTKYHLIRHKFAIHGIAHPTLQEFKCDSEHCEYVTYSKHMLKQHQRRHSDERPFTCEICAKSVKTAHVLEAHIKKVHHNIRPYICDQCGAAYGEEHELKLHMGRHDQVKEFRCEFCNYCSHLRGELRRHLYVVHNIKLDHKMQVYECNQCDYRTTHRNRFRDHQRWHRDVRDIKCPHCDKHFTTYTSQRGHIKAVHKPKHLKCSFCSYATSLVSQMKTHVRVMHTHPNHKPFKCAHCDFHCATSGNCRKHIMQRHKGLEVKWIKVAEKTPALPGGGDPWGGMEYNLPGMIAH